MNYLKTILFVLILVSAVFLLGYCGENDENLPLCGNCNNYIKEGTKYVEACHHGEVCAECVLRDEYVQCKYCGLYFDRDWHGHPNADYSNIVRLCCDKCAEEKLRNCYFCKEPYLEEELVKFAYNNETYYMCVRHCEGYFDVQAFKSCQYGLCVECVE